MGFKIRCNLNPYEHMDSVVYKKSKLNDKNHEKNKTFFLSVFPHC